MTSNWAPPREPIVDDVLDRSDQTERSIAVSRLVLAVAGIVITTVDQRPELLNPIYVVVALVLYAIYSAVLFWLFSTHRLSARRTSKTVLIVDVFWFAAIVALSEGGTTPFYLFYLFGVCTAAVRWGIRTTMRVAASSACIYFVSVCIVRYIAHDGDFGLHSTHFFRPVYLILLGYLVGTIGEQELTAKRRLIEMISMQRENGRSRSEFLTLVRLLRRVSRFFGADYVWFQIRPADGEGLDWLGTRSRSGRLILNQSNETGVWIPPMNSASGYRVSHMVGNWGRRVESYDIRTARFAVSNDDEPVFLNWSRARSVMSLPLFSQDGDRGLLILGRLTSNFSREDLVFCHSLVRQAGTIIQNAMLHRKAGDLAAAEERGRIARDLHDGFVQSLAAMDVRIQVCRRLFKRDRPQELRSELENLQSTVKQGYREAREYLEQLRTEHPEGLDVDDAIQGLVKELRSRSDLEIAYTCSAAGIPSQHGAGFDVLQIVKEGLTNIFRHAEASRASVDVAKNGEAFHISISDNGRGFATPVNEDGEIPSSAAPWSIRERVESLGGFLSIKSGIGRGSEIHITLPYRRTA